MKHAAYVLVVLLSIMTVAGHSQDSEPIAIPLGTLPTLDGTLGVGEWSDALALSLSPDFTLYLKFFNGDLFLGIRARTMGVPSPLVAQGEEIRVLHASAALGTATYAREGDQWVLQHPFEWRCRSVGFSAYAVQERTRFLDSEGWLGTLGYLGTPNEFEYQVRTGGEPPQMQFLFMETTDPSLLVSWPSLEDETAPLLPILTGPLPDEVVFDLTQWAVLVPSRP
jgi:hypothetical protein